MPASHSSPISTLTNSAGRRATSANDARLNRPADRKASRESPGAAGHLDVVTGGTNTGMRRGEVVGLTWSDLDPKAKRVSIQRTLQCVGGRPVEFGVKTRTSRRCIDLEPATVRELEQWRQRLCDEASPTRAAR